MISEVRLPQKSCVQITPTFPPEICGVGHYAAALSDELQSFGIDLWTVLAGQNPTNHPKRGQAVIGQDRRLLALALEPASTTLLHFSGYSYQRHGLCDWLVEALEDWRAGPGQRRLVTMFHEVYADGPIWRRSFWTSKRQKLIAARVAELSDVCFVSSYSGATQLQKVAPNVVTEVLPVFSNVGEPEGPLALKDRNAVGVVFGTLVSRQRVYAALSRSGSTGLKTLASLGVRTIIDIGAGDAVAGLNLGVEVNMLGPLPAEDVSLVLSSSRVGLVNYPDQSICKSGILAAYFAHGVLAINMNIFKPHPDEALHGFAYLSFERSNSDVCLQTIATNGHNWYRGHSMARTTQIISQVLVDRVGA